MSIHRGTLAKGRGTLLIVIVSIVTMCNLNTIATPTKFPESVSFPEQRSSGMTLRGGEGRELTENLFVLKVMSLLERKMEIEHGLIRNSLPNSFLFQGDIRLRMHDAWDLISNKRRRRKRKIQRDRNKRWILPICFSFDAAANYTEEEVNIIMSGIDDLRSQTCISFKEVDPNHTGNRIVFKDDKGCSSEVGMRSDPSPQNVSIGRSCMTKGIVAHELGHVIGFWHEHARPDRDEEIRVDWENIEDGNIHNFKMLNWDTISIYDVRYDASSLMHYSALAFSRDKENSKPTIESKDALMRFTMGQRNGLSFYDIKLANMAYCSDVCREESLTLNCLHDGYPDPKNCSRCRCSDGLGGDHCEHVRPSNGDCGGLVALTSDSVHAIQTPGYPSFFSANLSCYWRVESPEGTAIQVTFDPVFMNSSQCKQWYGPKAACTDYVELRHTANIAAAGARFCCEVEPPGTIITRTNQTLVLFRSVQSGDVGISANLSVVSCGGCYDNMTSPQNPCYKGTTYPCLRVWTEQPTCINSMLSSCEPAERTVEGTCYREDPLCCQGYVLENQQCVVSRESANVTETTDDSNSSSTNSSSETQSSDGTIYDVTSGWSDWSSWSNCTKKCGGCGTHTRTRDCSDTCEGSSSESSEPCNAKICEVGEAVHLCEQKKTEQTVCWSILTMSYEPCTIEPTTIHSVSAKCCCGYEKTTNNTCTKQ